MKNEKGKLYYGLGLDNDQLRADAVESRNIIKGIGDTTAAEGARIDNSYRKIAGTVAAVFTVQQAAAFAKSIVQVRGEIESLEISFETLLGNKQKANALFSEIKTYAVNTPMQMNDLAKGAQMLLSFNVEAERVMPILKQIGDISMGDAQKFNSLTLAFSQMSSTGKLMGQDLLQMINSGFNPLSVMSEKTGKSIGQLKKDMEGGLITSQMVADAFAAATAEGGKFYGMLDKQSKGINGSMSNLEGAITDIFNELGTENQEFITDTIQGATTAVKHYKEIGEALAAIVATYGTYKAAVMATEAVQRSIETVKRTEEAAELAKLLSVEQQAKISKLGLAKTSVEYAAAVKAEVAANVQGAQSALTKARAEVVAANQSVIARREEFVAAKQLESQRLAELMSIGATGSAKQVEAAQRKLSAAEMQRESAALAFQSATRDFNAKKTVVETAARTANTTATAANTAVQTANVTATGILSIAKTRLTAVAARLNAVIMANPYALAAAAVIALAYGIYKLVTYQTDAEKAQTKLNDAIKETNKNIDSEIHQVDSMFARLKNAKQGTDEYRAAKEAIMNRYGEYLKKLGDEKTALNDVAAAYKLIAEEAKKAARARAMESFTKEAADTLAEKEGDSKDEVKRLLEGKFKGKKGSDGISLAETYYWKIKPVIEGESQITSDIDSIIKQFDEKKLKIVDSDYQGNPVWDYVTTNAIKKEIDKAAKARGIYNKVMSEAQMKFGENPNANAPEAPKFDATTASLQQLMEQLPKAKDELDALKKADKPDPAAIAAKEQEIQQIKDQTAAREKSTTAIKDVKAQIELLQKEQEKYGKDDAEYKELETRIKSLKTKLPKTEGQESKAETDAARIKRETAERTKKIKEYEEAVKKQVKQSELDIAQARIDAMEDGYAKEQAQNEIAYQRLVLANQEREAQMVKALQDARELEWENKNPKAKAKGETFDRSTVTAADLSPEQQAQIKEFYTVAEGIRDKANRDSLEKMLGDFMTYEKKRNKITEEYEKKRKSMKNEDGSFKAGFTQGNVDELNRNENEALKAIDEQFAQRELTYIAWCDKIANDSIESLKKTLAQAKKELEIAEKSGASDSKLAAARAKVTKAKEKVDKADADKKASPGKRTLKEWKDLYETLQDVHGEFDKIGDAAGGVVGEIIDTAGQITTSTLNMINGIVQLANWATLSTKMTAEGVAASIQTVEKASVILTIISAAMQVATKIASLFSKDRELSEETKKSYESYMDVVDKLISQQKDLIAAVSGVQAVMANDKAVDAINKQILATRRLGIEYLASRKKGEHSYGVKMEDRLKNYASTLNASGFDWNQLRGSGRMEGLFELSADELRRLQQELPEVWSKIDGDAQKYLQTIIDCDEKIKELGETTRESLTRLSLDDARNELLDFLDNVESGMEDIGDSFEESMMKAVNKVIASGLDKQLEGWYTNFSKAMEDGSLSEAEREQLKRQYEAIYGDALKEREEMYSISGIDIPGSREAVKKGIATASQESVDENNGRLTVIQGYTFSLSENMKILIEHSKEILQILFGIRENTAHCARLESIEKDMNAVKYSLESINTKGITIKK